MAFHGFHASPWMHIGGSLLISVDLTQKIYIHIHMESLPSMEIHGRPWSSMSPFGNAQILRKHFLWLVSMRTQREWNQPAIVSSRPRAHTRCSSDILSESMRGWMSSLLAYPYWHNMPSLLTQLFPGLPMLRMAPQVPSSAPDRSFRVCVCAFGKVVERMTSSADSSLHQGMEERMW